MKTSTTNSARSWAIFGVIVLALAIHSLGAEDATKNGVYTGTLEAVSLTDQTITVKGREKSRTFRVAENAAISTLEKKDKSTLKDLRPGFTVEVTYAETSGKATATSV